MKTFTIEATIPEGSEVHPDDVLLAITGLGIDGKITVVSNTAGGDGSQLSFEWSRRGADSCFTSFSAEPAC